jgi:hypothetical protein
MTNIDRPAKRRDRAKAMTCSRIPESEVAIVRQNRIIITWN